MSTTLTMQFFISIVLVLLSSNIVKTEPNIAPSPSNLPNFQPSDKFDLLSIQQCATSVLSVKDCIIEILTPFLPPGGLPGLVGPPPGDTSSPGGGIDDVPPGDDGDGGALPGDGGGGGGDIGNWLPSIGGGLPGIPGPRDFIKPACCKVITGIKTNCWPMVLPNPFFPSLIERVCSGVI